MNEESKNKAMTGYENKSAAPSKPKEKKGRIQRFHFAGDGEYKTMSIEATSPAEAQAKWEKQRKKI
jgi:hypothetical protein